MAESNGSRPGKAVTDRVYVEVRKNIDRMNRGITIDELREFGVSDSTLKLAVALKYAQENGAVNV